MLRTFDSTRKKKKKEKGDASLLGVSEKGDASLLGVSAFQEGKG